MLIIVDWFGNGAIDFWNWELWPWNEWPKKKKRERTFQREM